MKSFNLTTVIAILSSTAACHVGPQIENKDIARQPYGANVLVAVAREGKSKTMKHRGELLEVRDDGLVIAAVTETDGKPRVVMIPWALIDRAKATDLPGIETRQSYRERQRADTREKLRNVSRYPQGLPPEIMDKLLASYGQATIESVE